MKKVVKKFNSKIYLYIAIGGLAAIMVLTAFYLLTPVVKGDEAQYIYIDTDDTQDSVLAKIHPVASPSGMTGLSTLIRHSHYGEDIRTGRYKLEPGDGAVTVFRRLKNGQQSSMNLTIPEARTMERLASILGRKLMLDSAPSPMHCSARRPASGWATTRRLSAPCSCPTPTTSTGI